MDKFSKIPRLATASKEDLPQSATKKKSVRYTRLAEEENADEGGPHQQTAFIYKP